MIRRFQLGVAGCLVLAVSGCAVGSPPSDDSSSGGSQLSPHLRAQHDRAGSGPSSSSASPRHRATHPAPAGDTPPTTGGTADAAATAPATPGDSTTPGSTVPGPAGAGPASASLSDRAGDASGIGSPGFVDLTGATVTRDAGRYRASLEVAAPLPPRQTDDRTMNTALFVDADRDGQVDYEMWASLSDTGWSTSYRYPDGARFGGDSGVTVAVSGSTLTLGFPADHVGGAASFRWAVGAEYGTLEQVASGTSAQDLAPDSGARPFPG